MAYTPCEVATDNISKLDDQPNDVGGLTSSELKALFDKFGAEFVAWFNATHLAELNAISDGYTANSLSRQAIINGNFDIWQRGVTFTNPATAAYLADRWSAFFNLDGGTLPANIVYSKQQFNPGELDKSFNFFRMNFDGAGSNFGANAFHILSQAIEHGVRNLCGTGKKVTVSFYARSNIVGKRLGIVLVQNYGTGGNPSAQEVLYGSALALNNAWTKYSITINTNTLTGKTFGTNNDDRLRLYLVPMWGSNWGAINMGAAAAETFIGAGNVDIAQVQVCAGDIALPFQPKSFEEELRACMRYFEKSYDPVVAPGTSTGSNMFNAQTVSNLTLSGNRIRLNLPFKVPKRAVPTMACYDQTGNVGKISTVDGDTVTHNVAPAATVFEYTGISGTGILSAQGPMRFHWTADAEL